MSVARTRVTFSPDTDEHGFPIWADVDWSDCKSIEIATANQIPLIGDAEGNQSRVSEYFSTPATAEALKAEADRLKAEAEKFRARAAAFDARDAYSFK
jgi:hypothetical protein